MKKKSTQEVRYAFYSVEEFSHDKNKRPTWIEVYRVQYPSLESSKFADIPIWTKESGFACEPFQISKRRVIRLDKFGPQGFTLENTPIV